MSETTKCDVCEVEAERGDHPDEGRIVACGCGAGVCDLCARPETGDCGRCAVPGECARCGQDTEDDLVRHYEDGGPRECSRCGLTIPVPGISWQTNNGYLPEAAA